MRMGLNRDRVFVQWILLSTLFGIVRTLQVGFLTDQVLLYNSSATVTTVSLDNTSSCDPCICAAFQSPIAYVAINCHRDNHICFLLTSTATIIKIISSPNNAAYILPDTISSTTSTASATEVNNPTSADTSGISPDLQQTLARTEVTTTSRCVLDPILHTIICIN